MTITFTPDPTKKYKYGLDAASGFYIVGEATERGTIATAIDYLPTPERAAEVVKQLRAGETYTPSRLSDLYQAQP